jgi:hypothetical protein
LVEAISASFASRVSSMRDRLYMEYSRSLVTSLTMSRKSGSLRSLPFRVVYVSRMMRPLHLEKKKGKQIKFWLFRKSFSLTALHFLPKASTMDGQIDFLSRC